MQGNIERGELTLANQTLASLIEHKVAHCAYEEKLLQESGYPFLKPHQRVHDEYIKECRAYLRRAQQGEYVAQKALAFVKPWMVSHIQGEDLDYAHFVKQHLDKGAEPVVPWHLRTLNRFFPNGKK
ncbi:MAG: hypothetical protein Fur0026_03710 [Sideroxydans sp.]